MTINNIEMTHCNKQFKATYIKISLEQCIQSNDHIERCQVQSIFCDIFPFSKGNS